MVRDNKDRYGNRHREDPAYDMGESKPGDVGDSKGTFHDRASSDNNVIVDGEVKNYESHKRNNSNKKHSVRSGSNGEADNQDEEQSHGTHGNGQYAELDGNIVEVEVDRISGSGNAIAMYQGMHVHVPDGEPGESYEVELNADSGYFVGKVKVRE
ncbi:hypothetical protein [Halobacterium salinarum]|uniref:TRAM domain-containing protein n=1 Tax=Halobacterium salinarum (strain ATCC 33171 / DSM 3754 / JCM 8978 / NBRC 102687 / NCIMB 764 / 91-R6) TaxID=2597657 RepID=A0A4D6GWM9_HALS9|nr:hypothetical protein [Halobacterium salinarum]QCC46163.1 uncharacterized protein HBSAL_13265 [Halobacterium salinarum]TYO73833.1 hypothetical protein APQ99_02371 [Halobacterium salinarum DSM 3754]